MTCEASQAVPLLDYAPTPLPFYRCRSFRRCCCIAFVLAATISAGYLYRDALARTYGAAQNAIELRRLFDSCMAHTYAADRVLFDEARDAIKVNGGRAARDPATWTSGPVSFARYTRMQIEPRVWATDRSGVSDLYQLQVLDDRIAGRVRCVSGIRQPYPSTMVTGGDELFVHARRSGNGEERLVVVGFSPTAFMYGARTPFMTQVISKPDWLRSAETKFGLRTWSFEFVVPTDQPLKLYAGQPDSFDESHFTIAYETPTGSGTIDGWLSPDDTVTLTVRDGPAASQ